MMSCWRHLCVHPLAPAGSCSLIGSQWLGQAGHFLQDLIVGFLVVLVWLDEDDTGGPLGSCRRSQVLEAGGGGASMRNSDDLTRKSSQKTSQTHNFRGDVGVGQVPVLTHDGQVTVDVDGQGVSSQDHDAAHTAGGGGESGDAPLKEAVNQHETPPLTLSLPC